MQLIKFSGMQWLQYSKGDLLHWMNILKKLKIDNQDSSLGNYRKKGNLGLSK